MAEIEMLVHPPADWLVEQCRADPYAAACEIALLEHLNRKLRERAPNPFIAICNAEAAKREAAKTRMAKARAAKKAKADGQA